MPKEKEARKERVVEVNAKIMPENWAWKMQFEFQASSMPNFLA
jgi:hypothetical protein